MLKSSPQTQQRSNHNCQEVVWESSHHLSSYLPSCDLLLMCPPFVNDPVVAHLSCGPFLDQSLVLRLCGSHILCPPPYVLVIFTPDVSLPLSRTLSSLTSPVALFQTSLWSSGFGMKMEAITPFLGKYRPFMGRCCQTCTPKSWVSDETNGPSFAKRTLA